MLTDIINAAYFQAVRAAFQDFYLSFSGVHVEVCLLYTSDAADDLRCVDLGGRRIIKKKKQINI